MPKKTNKKHRVRVRTLNDFIDLQQCNFLKIDVELMELSVLKGAKEFIKKIQTNYLYWKSSWISKLFEQISSKN